MSVRSSDLCQVPDMNVRAVVAHLRNVDGWLIVGAIFTLLLAALLFPLDWIVRSAPDVPPSADSGEYRLADVVEASANLPGDVEFQNVPVARWIKPTLKRLTPGGLRGLLLLSSDKAKPEELWALVSSAEQLNTLVTPKHGCEKNSILLSRIPFTKSRTDTDRSFGVIRSSKTTRSELRSEFCFLRKRSNVTPSQPGGTVPPIVVQYPKITFEPSAKKIYRLPAIVVSPPLLKPSDDWSTPKRLPHINVARPAIVPMLDWSTPQHLPPVRISAPRDESGTRQLAHSSSSGELNELGTVYFELACPQLNLGPKCSARDGNGERSSLAEQRTLISKAVHALNDGPNVIFVIGSADPVGERAYNTKLADKRARTIFKDIENRACPPNRTCPRDLRDRLIERGIGEIPVSGAIKKQPEQRRVVVFVYKPNDVLTK